NVSYRVLPALAVSAGQFKTPFSAEFLTYAGSIDFVNRSQVVTALSPGRQIGVQLGGEIAKNELSYLVGVFNGNGISTNGNEGDNFLSVARVMINPIGIASQPQSGFLGLGVNAAHSKETDATLAGGLLRGFTGTRVLVGGDILFVSGPVYLSAEFIYSRLRSIDRSSRDPYGFHATAGYRVAERSQLLLRVDSFAADGLQEDSHLVIAGYNFWPTQVTELQINYIVPTIGAGFKNHQLLVNAQLGF
ncbi:MAG: hypothetical protein IH628_09750, partial [Proteobacteria bacterium]|nr:hypothetical protein [Pseudomonadota bacterium]